MYYPCMSQTAHQNIHLLLPKEELKVLRLHSKKQRKSIAELIRFAVKKVYGHTEPDKRWEAYQRLMRSDELKMDDWAQVKRELSGRYG